MKNKKTGLRVGSHTQIRRRTEVTEQKGTKMVSYISVPIQYCTTHKHFVRLQLGSSGAFYTAARPRASKHQFCSLMMQIIMFLEACQTYLLGPPEYLIFFACCLGSSSAKNDRAFAGPGSHCSRLGQFLLQRVQGAPRPALLKFNWPRDELDYTWCGDGLASHETSIQQRHQYRIPFGNSVFDCFSLWHMSQKKFHWGNSELRKVNNSISQKIMKSCWHLP